MILHCHPYLQQIRCKFLLEEPARNGAIAFYKYYILIPIGLLALTGSNVPKILFCTSDLN